jgi:putative transposase
MFFTRTLAYDDKERQLAYREVFRHELEPGEIDKIRKATNGNFALGSSELPRK